MSEANCVGWGETLAGPPTRLIRLLSLANFADLPTRGR